MSDAGSVPQPLPDRECGDCTVCCVHLEIDDPQLQKPDEVACPNLLSGCGCGVYADRPRLCAKFFCGWRLINLSDRMRPDLSGVLLLPEICREPGLQRGGLRLVSVSGNQENLLQAEVVDLAGRCISNGVPIFLSHGSGRHCKRILINRIAASAVGAGDRAAFVSLLTAILADMAGQVATTSNDSA